MRNNDLAQRLQRLFAESGDAHHQAYIETNGDDPEWPIWYAAYLKDKLGMMLSTSFTQSELVYLLLDVEKKRQAISPVAEWTEYYTRYFMKDLPKEA